MKCSSDKNGGKVRESSFFHKSNRSEGKSPRGFTLIELIVAVTILGILTLAALSDYGSSIKRARLQVATDQLVALFEQMEVSAQTAFYEDVRLDEADQPVVCWGIGLTSGGWPVSLRTPWLEGDAACETDDSEWSEQEVMYWSPQVWIDDLDWTAESSSGSQSSDESTMIFFFTPQAGEMQVYREVGDSFDRITDVTEVRVGVSYEGASDDLFHDTVRIVPVTSSVVVE